MSLRPDTRDSLTAAAQTLADDYGCGLPRARRALWDAVCRYVQPPGMAGDVRHSAISPADVDAAYLDLRADWDLVPPPKAVPSPFPSPDLSAPVRCKSDKCRALIRWGKLNGRTHPFDLDGLTSHYSTCKDADRFRGQRGGV